MNTINVYAVVAPAVLVLILVEFIYCIYKKNGYYTLQDSLMGMGTMIIAQCVNVAVTVMVLAAYGWIYHHFALTHIELNAFNLIAAYILSDFLFYWFHRAGHRINILWAAHVPHHSAEELNYAVALRASFTQRAASFLFYWPMAVIGFAPDLVLVIVAINLVYQLIPHTRVVGHLPKWIESWLNCPYHHQVHHAANRIYWDKNYGGTLIIWDKIFGTYQEQTEPLYYGVAIHPQSWDPLKLNMHWFLILWNDMKLATHGIDKLKIWFMPPGWRPRNLPPYPKNPPHTALTQVKYVTHALQGSRYYLIFQLITNMFLMILVIHHQSVLSVIEKIIMSVFLYLAVTVWAAILESKTWARQIEFLRILVQGIFLAYVLNVHQMPSQFAVLNGLLTFVFLFWFLLKVEGPTKNAQPQTLNDLQTQ